MTTLADLWNGSHSGPLPKFEVVARYIAPMDCLIYLREDVSYRAVRLSAFTTVLLHPYEDRPVGIKLKGMRYLYERLNAILQAAMKGRNYRADIDLSAIWEVALTAAGDEAIATAETKRQRQLTKRVREEIITEAIPVAVEEFADAA